MSTQSDGTTEVLHKDDFFEVRKLGENLFEVEYKPSESSSFTRKGETVGKAFDRLMEAMSKGQNAPWRNTHESRFQTLASALADKDLIEV